MKFIFEMSLRCVSGAGGHRERLGRDVPEALRGLPLPGAALRLRLHKTFSMRATHKQTYKLDSMTSYIRYNVKKATLYKNI